MRARIVGAMVLALGVVTGSASGAQGVSRAADAPPPVTILPLGDSITHGYQVPGGYRSRLEDSLLARGIRVDFVGSRRDGPADLADPDHEGHPGLRIDELSEIGVDAVGTRRPRYVLLLAGTNDVLQSRDLPQAPGRLVGLVDKMLAASPTTTVVVSTLPPVTMWQGANDAAQKFNGELRAALAGRGARVVLTEAGAAVPAGELSDGVHPTQAGYDRLGEGFAAALLPLLQPRPAPAPKPTNRPAPKKPAVRPAPKKPAARPAAKAGELFAEFIPPRSR